MGILKNSPLRPKSFPSAVKSYALRRAGDYAAFFETLNESWAALQAKEAV